jgi:hypothetical protein
VTSPKLLLKQCSGKPLPSHERWQSESIRTPVCEELVFFNFSVLYREIYASIQLGKKTKMRWSNPILRTTPLFSGGTLEQWRA